MNKVTLLLPHVWINGTPQYLISVADRGLQYGDGVFETVLMQNHCLPLLNWHIERLKLSTTRLSIPFDEVEMRDELKNFVATLSDQNAIIKIMYTRGCGERGYLAPLEPSPARILIASPMRDWSSLARDGLVVRLCRQRIMELPEVAGLKILGRLDLVLARNEWRDTDIHEGLLSDSRENIIEGTMTNIFLVMNGALVTPSLETAGVKGVTRRIILERIAEQLGLVIEERQIHKADLYAADELFICNSVMGVMPVKQLEDHRYTSNKLSLRLRESFATYVNQHCIPLQ